MEILKHTENDIMFLRIKGDIDLNTSSQLQEDFKSLITTGLKKVIVNLSEVAYIDSSGLGTLIGGLKMFNTAGKKIVLVGLNTNLKKIFEITRVKDFFNIYETEEQAKFVSDGS